MAITDLVAMPYRVVTSKPAQKTYLNTILLLISSSILFGIAVVAYIIFYYNYVPQIGIEKAVHLQYGDGTNPYSIIVLSPDIFSLQPYDITLSLHVPRSPRNLEAGNFMLSLSLLSPSYKPSITAGTPAQDGSPTLISAIQPTDILFSSRRPVLLRYTSRLVSLSERLASLPLYILGLKHESEVLNIPIFELISFQKGRKNVPTFAFLEVQARQDIQVYDVRLQFTARFGGLRWWMYHHRLISFATGVAIFWSAEIIFTLFAWVLLPFFFAPSPSPPNKVEANDPTATSLIKNEPSPGGKLDLVGTPPRTFPACDCTSPLHNEPKVKEEHVVQEMRVARFGADDEIGEVVRNRGFGSGLRRSNSAGEGGSSLKRRKGRWDWT
ncbi:putative adipose-regulatory protein-domain-containing protein [Amylocarpus encephaloides]|uniref:Adipose-regulatory protein-domain-containing protein n=1 Tax=Amylocarpus encephaloides TaxID=45428 RepID=A0A9P7Y8F7_9HELO|nr:putative adipose-regulatory protein-domain-containing protein [Amylocarpus encephaloides]